MTQISTASIPIETRGFLRGVFTAITVLGLLAVFAPVPSVAQTANKNCLTGDSGGTCSSPDLTVRHNQTGVITAACQNTSTDIYLHCFWKHDKNANGCTQNIPMGPPGSSKCECPNQAEGGPKTLTATVSCTPKS